MNCAAVRDRLADHAIGVMSPADADPVDRHLAWCAACRKESEDLRRGAALLPYALAPVTPADDLDEKVIAAVHRVAGSKRGSGRRGRSVVAAVAAASIAVAGLGWGAVMAGRADRLGEQVRAAREAQHRALEGFSRLIRRQQFSNDDVFIGALSGPAGSAAGGGALVLISRTDTDFAIATVSGLPAGVAEPYSVTLEGTDGTSAAIGKIDHLDTGGEGQVGRAFDRDITGLTHVVVRDATGTVVMTGVLSLQAAVPSASISPSPGSGAVSPAPAQ